MVREPKDRFVLHAGVVTCGLLEFDVDHVGWSSDGADGPHLIIMRNFGDPDGYCVVTQDGTCYGGVESFAVVGDETRLLVSQDAAGALGLTTDIVLVDVSRQLDPEDVRTNLTRLLGEDSTNR